MEYLLKVKEDKKGKALVNHLKSLDFVELDETHEEMDPLAFREMISKAEKSKPRTLDELKAHIASWSEKNC
ncbi:MAG TPA: hypothetical protein VE978_23060 [Chitinophagales bacterium]|nr:hypothetical protein [Chitinophagales bacterium]